MNCLIKSLFLCNFKKFQHIPDWNYSSGKWSAEPSSLAFQSYIEILWVAPSGLEISVLEKCDFHDFTWQSYLCDVQRYSLLPRLKLFTQELGSRLSIVAVAFLSNLLGASFLVPILERVVCYSELCSYRIWKSWFLSLLLKPVQTNKASSDNAILTKRDSMSHTHALCFVSRLLSIPGHKLSHQKSAIFVHMHTLRATVGAA